MNHQSDYGYSTGAISMRCIACGSNELNCCDGKGNRISFFFREIEINSEFWCDGKFWIKINSGQAESDTTIARFEPDEVVMVQS